MLEKQDLCVATDSVATYTLAMTQQRPTSLYQEVGKNKPFDVPEQEAYLNLVRTHAQLSRAFARLFKSHGISDAQYNALRIVVSAGADGIRSESIGARMVARDPDTTRLVNRLEKSGHVRRESVPGDRRCVVVVATEDGHDTVRALDGCVLELHREQLNHLTPHELDELNRLLFKARHPISTDDTSSKDTP